MSELVKLLKDMGWSWVLWLVVGLFIIKSVVDMAAETWEPIRKALGWYGRRITEKRERREAQAETLAALRAENDDLKARLAAKPDPSSEHLAAVVEQLASQLRIVRWRNEMTDAYLVEDADFHRDVALNGITGLPAHTPFPEFERQWKRKHPPPKPTGE